MTGLSQMFHEGGWGMWPTLFFGVLALFVSASHAVKPRREWLPLIVGLGLATLFSGGLGVTMGIINTLKYTQGVPVAEQTSIAYVGVSESLFNVVLALIVATLVALVAGLGSYRGAIRSARAAS